MPALTTTSDELVLTFSPAERLFAFRSQLVVPLSSIQSVRLVVKPMREVRGLRAPGIHIPFVLAIGTWRRLGTKDFVAVRARQQGLVIELSGEEFKRIVLSLDDPKPIMEQLACGRDNERDAVT